MISKNRMKAIEHFVVKSLTSIMFDRKIFGTSSEIFGNLRKSKYLNFEWNYCPCNVGNWMKISTYAVWSNWAVQQHRKSRPGILFVKLATPLDLFGNLPQPITCCDMAYVHVCQSTTGHQAAWLVDIFRR